MTAAAILLQNPKVPFNVASAIRASAAYACPEVIWDGERVFDGGGGKGRQRLPREERMRGYAGVRRLHVDDITQQIDRLASSGAAIVALEFDDGTRGYEDLTWFAHPLEAAYVFGPEDGSVNRAVRERAHRLVAIPTLHCINLGAAIYTVLWDRYQKERRA